MLPLFITTSYIIHSGNICLSSPVDVFECLLCFCHCFSFLTCLAYVPTTTGNFKPSANPGKKTICLLPIGEPFLINDDDDDDDDNDDADDADDGDDNVNETKNKGGNSNKKKNKKKNKNSFKTKQVQGREAGRISRRAIRRYTEAYFHGMKRWELNCSFLSLSLFFSFFLSFFFFLYFFFLR
jgi:hypothetical protein